MLPFSKGQLGALAVHSMIPTWIVFFVLDCYLPVLPASCRHAYSFPFPYSTSQEKLSGEEIRNFQVPAELRRRKVPSPKIVSSQESDSVPEFHHPPASITFVDGGALPWIQGNSNFRRDAGRPLSRSKAGNQDVRSSESAYHNDRLNFYHSTLSIPHCSVPSLSILLLLFVPLWGTTTSFGLV